MKNETLVWQKIATIAMLAAAFIAIISFTSCDDHQPRTPSTIADEVIHYSGDYEIVNDSIAVRKGDGTAHRDYIYKKLPVIGRWKRVM
jgi:hypothetical protein